MSNQKCIFPLGCFSSSSAKSPNAYLLPLITLIAQIAISSSAVAQGDAITVKQYVDQTQGTINSVSTEGLLELLETDSELRLIDVRTADEIAHGGGSIDAGLHPININRGWLEFRITDAIPDKRTAIVVYCGTNQRSPLAARTLLDMGYRNVYNYTDGYFAWKESGLPISQPDEAPGSMLFRMPMEVAPGVWTAIGATAPPTYENSGHNNNLSFVITDAGVVVINAGDNYLLAQALHNEIRQLTDQSVIYVILENGQGHAMLGSNYWQEQGAVVIAHEDAIEEIKHNGEEILSRMQRRNRDKAMGTRLTLPDESIADLKVLNLGDERIEILYPGPAHSPGDIIVWLPQRHLAIAGDIAFHQRLLPVFEHTDTAAWIHTWQSFADLQAQLVIPGHGEPTVMPVVEKYTIGYLKYMRKTIGELLENGGSLIDAYQVDQSAYRHLDTFNELAVLNADRIYRSMEFE